MLSLTRQTDYAVRILVHIAALGSGAQDTIDAIARQRHLPAPFIRRLTSSLIRARLLRSKRGAQGGLSLGRPAESLSLLMIIEALEGPIVFNACLHAGHRCPLMTACPVQGIWRQAGVLLSRYLDSVTVADLCNAHAQQRPPLKRSKRLSHSRRP